MQLNIFEQKLIDYMITQVTPKMPEGLIKFGTYFSLGIIKANPSMYLSKYEELGRNMGIINKENEVDIQQIKDGLQFAFTKEQKLNILGFVFSQADLPTFFNFIGV